VEEGTRELSELKESSEWGNERGMKMDPPVKPEDDVIF